MDKALVNGMMGLVTGDALGVPVQFFEKNEIRTRPEGRVKGMERGGVYNMPAGTWSDDSSMAIATLDSILERKHIDPEDIMCRFVQWYVNDEYTPADEAFDMGNTCSMAIEKYMHTRDIYNSGESGEYSNGNGALMRILPVCIYSYERKKADKEYTDKDAIKDIDAVSSLTHAHVRSMIGCGLYYFIVSAILDRRSKMTITECIQLGVDHGLDFYNNNKASLVEISMYMRMFSMNYLRGLPESDISSSGYVVSTLESALWCLITTGSYRDSMLKAVNLGGDTDTIAAVAGGLAGLYYGYDEIPEEWLNVIKRRKWIEDMCIKPILP